MARAAEEGGFIRLHRKIHEHPYWQDPERFRAWVDLLFLAAWKTHRKLVGAEQLTIRRGEFVASERFLARRWGWTRAKVRRFLASASEASEIRPINETTSGTIYSVVNYSSYQDKRPTKRPTKKPSKQPASNQQETKENEGIKKGESLFARFRDAYPARAGSQRWQEAEKRFSARQKEGVAPEEMVAAAARYSMFCEAVGRTGTEYVKQAASFLGDPENLESQWEPPRSQNGRKPDPRMLTAEETRQRVRDSR